MGTLRSLNSYAAFTEKAATYPHLDQQGALTPFSRRVFKWKVQPSSVVDFLAAPFYAHDLEQKRDEVIGEMRKLAGNTVFSEHVAPHFELARKALQSIASLASGFKSMGAKRSRLQIRVERLCRDLDEIEPKLLDATLSSDLSREFADSLFDSSDILPKFRARWRLEILLYDRFENHTNLTIGAKIEHIRQLLHHYTIIDDDEFVTATATIKQHVFGRGKVERKRLHNIREVRAALIQTKRKG